MAGAAGNTVLEDVDMPKKHDCWANAQYGGPGKLICGICGRELKKPVGRLPPRLRQEDAEKEKP
jgi:hypothetical protein